jgi:tetratricopeptide (TPR) repeat protein
MAIEDDIQEQYESGAAYLIEGDIESARPCLRKLMKIAPDDVRTIELSGDFARHRGDYDKADKFYRQLVTISDDLEVLAISLMNRGVNYQAQDLNDEAAQMYTQAIDAYKRLEDNEGLVSCYSQLGTLYTDSGKLRPALALFESALELFIAHSTEGSLLETLTAVEENEFDDVLDDEYDEEEGARLFNEYTRANLELEIGQINRMLGNLETAVEQISVAVERYQAIGDDVQVANALDCLGVVRQIQGDYEAAETLHKTAAEINEDFDNEEGLSVNYGNLAILARHRKDFDVAETYINKAYQMDKTTFRKDGTADYYIKIGEVKYERGEHQEAEANLLKALQIYKKLNDIGGVCVAHSHLGVLYRMKGDYTRSEELTLKALKICEEMEHLDYIACVVDELGLLRKEQGRVDEARELWTRSLGLFEQMQALVMIERTKQALAEL